ncbi:MAG: hypothetical protein JWO19_4888 [Bryobacterales bacterium]|nr:hypothetical protein [Bryobacterales bacterium]
MTFETRLDDDCLEYLRVRRLRISQRAIALYLGWDENRAEAVRKRIDRHKANQAAHKQYFSTATRAGREVFSLYFPHLTQACPQNEIFGVNIEIVMNEQITALDQARLKLDDLIIQSRSANAHVAEIEGRISELEGDIELDGADAVLNGRALDKSLSKQLDAAIAELKTARHIAKSHQLAVAKLEATVCRLEDEIHARRFEMFSKAVSEPQKRLDKAVIELMSAAIDVTDLCSAHGFAESHVLVSRDDLNDDGLGRLVSVVRTALQAAHYWETFYDNAPTFHKTNHPQPFVVPHRAIPVDPIQQKINAERERLASLNEQFAILRDEQRRADGEADGLRYRTRSVEGGWIPMAPGDRPEFNRLRSIVEAKDAEIKANEAERQKCIQEIAGLEKQLQQKRFAAA